MGHLEDTLRGCGVGLARSERARSGVRCTGAEATERLARFVVLLIALASGGCRQPGIAQPQRPFLDRQMVWSAWTTNTQFSIEYRFGFDAAAANGQPYLLDSSNLVLQVVNTGSSAVHMLAGSIGLSTNVPDRRTGPRLYGRLRLDEVQCGCHCDPAFDDSGCKLTHLTLEPGRRSEFIQKLILVEGSLLWRGRTNGFAASFGVITGMDPIADQDKQYARFSFKYRKTELWTAAIPVYTVPERNDELGGMVWSPWTTNEAYGVEFRLGVHPDLVTDASNAMCPRLQIRNVGATPVYLSAERCGTWGYDVISANMPPHLAGRFSLDYDDWLGGGHEDEDYPMYCGMTSSHMWLAPGRSHEIRVECLPIPEKSRLRRIAVSFHVAKSTEPAGEDDVGEQSYLGELLRFESVELWTEPVRVGGSGQQDSHGEFLREWDSLFKRPVRVP